LSTWVWLLAGAAVVALLSWRWFHRLARVVHAEKARELFRLQAERLHAEFLSAAAATGKPRGLVWSACEFGPDFRMARDRDTGEFVALAPLTVRFEAVEGGDMEGLPAVGNLRNATAVFTFAAGRWQTAGRAVFNLNPDEALARFQARYERIAAA
jgi:hypothetical protein